MNQAGNILPRQVNPNCNIRPYGMKGEAFPQEEVTWNPQSGIINSRMAASMAMTRPRGPGPSLMNGSAILNSALNVKQQYLGNSLPYDVMMSGELPFQGVGSPAPNMLMNMDIPSTNFMKAMNFEALSDGSSHERRIKGDVESDLSVSEQLKPEADEDLESGSLGEQELDISADIVEQQQAREQAQLLHRFKELQRWQQQQQELLLLQQQQQLEALRDEQAKVHFMIARQREMTWGASGPSTNGVVNGFMPASLPTTPPISTSQKNSHRNVNVRGQGGSTIPQGGSTIPHALAQGALAMAKLQQVPGYAEVQAPSSVMHVNGLPPRSSSTMVANASNEIGSKKASHASGRPLPHFRERASTPVEYRENGNPHLDSDSNTIDSMSNITDEGMCPLPDTASESSDNVPLLRPPSSFQKLTIPHGEPSHKLHNAEHNIQSQNHDLIYTVDSVTNMTKINQTGQNRVDLINGYEGNSNNNHKRDEFDLLGPDLDDMCDMDVLPVIQDANNRPLNMLNSKNNPWQQQYEGTANPYPADVMHGDADEEVTPSPRHYEEDGLEGEIIEEQISFTPKSFDDKPVPGIGGQQKTFEELLEDELRKEEERLVNDQLPEETALNAGKKTFLRKGQGVARFGPGAFRNQKVKQPVHLGSKDWRTSTNGAAVSKNIRNHDHMPAGRSTAKSTNCEPTKVTTKKPLGPQKPSLTRQPPSKPPRPGLSLKSRQKSQVSSTATHLVAPKSKKSPPQLSAKPPALPSQPLPFAGDQSKPMNQNGKVKEDLGKGGAPAGRNNCTVSDTSFVRKLKEREENEEVEKDELEEFELLEQYADDNASFLSNISAVNRVVEQQKAQTRTTLSGDTGKKRPGPSLNQLPVTDDDDDDVDKLSEDSTEEEDSSSTSDDDSDSLDNTLTKDMAANGQVKTPEETSNVRVLHRKVASLEQRSPVKSRRSHSPGDMSPGSLQQLEKVQQWVSDSEHEEDDQSHKPLREDIHIHDPHTTSQLDSDFSESETEEGPSQAISHVQLHSKFDSKITNGIHDKNHNTDKFSNSEIHTDEETVDQTVKSNQQPATGYVDVQKKLNFGDDEAWEDSSIFEDENEDPDISVLGSGHSKDAPKGSCVQNQAIFKAKGVANVGGAGDASCTVTPPPTSRLVTKLFPKLKVEKPKPQEQVQKLEAVRHAEPGEGVQSKALRDKLAELEREIERFRTENTTLAKLRKEREDGLSELQKQMQEFDKLKTEELKRLQDFKNEEMKKLKHERKMFDQYQKAVRAMPDKKEREEIDALKKQVSDLQDEMKRKEQRWTSSSSRLRDRVEALETENVELKEEIKVLERKRLESWQQREAAVSSQKEVSKKASGSQPKAPSPQIKPSSAVHMDNALRLSSDAVLDETKEDATPIYGIPEAESMPVTRPVMAKKPTTSSPKKKDEDKINVEERKSIPRKKTMLFSITNTVDKGNDEYEEIQHSDGKVEKIYSNGAREILFTNGTRKQVSADGQSIIVSFFNGDIKQIMPDQRVVYYYADAQTTHTTYPDGLEILQFPNQQVEKHYPDGTKEISFPDQTIKYLFPSGIEESIFPDGTVIRVEQTGDKTIEFPNGQREIHTQQYKRREYPDGTVKTVYPDGRQETRYSSGRIRVKDRDGNIIVDKRT